MTTPEKITQLLNRKRKLEHDLVSTEQQIYDLETSYLEETAGYNIARGWKGFHKVPVPLKKIEGTTLPYTDHIFSLSSVTSPLGTIYPWAESLHSNKELAKLMYNNSSSSSSSVATTIFSSTSHKPNRAQDSTTTTSSSASSASHSTPSSTIRKATTPNKSTPQKTIATTVTPVKGTPLTSVKKASTIVKKVPPSTSKKK